MRDGSLKISVVTPTLNRAGTIEQTLRSVSSQTYENVEHVLQDGGSTDATLSILRKWSNQHSVRVQSGRDNGLYDAVNKGIARSRGDVIGLLGSDDFLSDPGVLAGVAAGFSDPSVDGVYGDLDIISATGRVLRHWQAGSFRRDRLRWGWMPPHPTLYLRRSVFDRLGVYDTRYRIAGDYDAMLRWIWTGKIKLAYVPRIMVKMRHGGVSTGSVRGVMLKSREDYCALRSNNVGGLGALAVKNLRKVGQFSALVRSAQH